MKQRPLECWLLLFLTTTTTCLLFQKSWADDSGAAFQRNYTASRAASPITNNSNDPSQPFPLHKPASINTNINTTDSRQRRINDINNNNINDKNDTSDPAYALLFPWVTQAAGVGLFWILSRVERLGVIPYAAWMFGLGALWGAGSASQGGNGNMFWTSVEQWSNMDSSVLLLVFLPGLIFRDALEINFVYFCQALVQIVILAFPMVLVGTVATACVGVWILPYGWSWSLAATLGAILASTDPIAVGSVLKQAGAPARLQMHISGESLLNDGSAVVFYTLFSQQYLSELGFADAVNVGQGFLIFFRMSLGGVCVGIAFAGGLLLMLHELDRRLEPQYNVLQVVAALTMAYLSYYVSEQVCAMSGVIACVVCGLVARALGKGLIRDNQLMDSYLALMEHLLNTLLFTLGGVVWGKVIAEGVQGEIGGMDAVYLLLVYSLVMVIRFMQVGLFYPVFAHVGLKSDWREATFLAYGGLRGAVGVALALALNRSVREETNDPEILKQNELVEFFAGGVTILTLLINGSTAGTVLQWLKLSKPVTSRRRALRLFRRSAEAFLESEYEQLLIQPRFEQVQETVVRKHVPFASFLDNNRNVQDNNDTKFPPIPLHRRMSSMISEDFSLSPQILEASARGCSDELVEELRQLFMELLSEAYNYELLNSELDEREHNGQILDVLRQSVVIATTDVEHHQSIHDYEYVVNVPYQEDAKSLFARCQHRLTWWKLNSEDGRCCTYEFKRQRTIVLRTLAFIEAHQRAERKLVRYMSALTAVSLEEGDLAMLMDDGIDTVLKESAEQVSKAQAFLDGMSTCEIEDILSHYLCSILNRKLAAFVEQNAGDGILLQTEAKDLLGRIDRHETNVHTCQSCLTG